MTRPAGRHYLSGMTPVTTTRPPHAAGAFDPPLAALLDRRFRPLVERGRLRGLVAAAVSPAAEADAWHGGAGPGRAPLGPRSIFEIGSITKTFTAILLACMVAAGEVGLDDPIG